jgi:hypothetical protein
MRVQEILHMRPDITSTGHWPESSKGKSNGIVLAAGSAFTGKVGRFLVAHPLPDRLLYAEPLRRRMRVRFGGA